MSKKASGDAFTRNCDADVCVTAYPQRITMGGIVLLTAAPPDPGTYHVAFMVEGPARFSGNEGGIALLGATTINGGRVACDADHPVRAALDTKRLSVGAWTVRARFLPALVDGVSDGPEHVDVGCGDSECDHSPCSDSTCSEPECDHSPCSDSTCSEPECDHSVCRCMPRRAAQLLEGGPAKGHWGESDPIEVVDRPFRSGDDVSVTMRRTAVAPTADQVLWVAIRNSTRALGFEPYELFMDRVMCGWSPEREDHRWPGKEGHKIRKSLRRTALPFPNVDQYRLLKAATEVFLMCRCGVDVSELDVDLEEEARRLNRTVQIGDVEAEFRALVAPPAGDDEGLPMLPYLRLIRRKLGDVPVVGFDDDDRAAQACYGILAKKLTSPCFIELLWSYWHERAGLPRAINAILWRFQNRTSSGDGHDPLAGVNIDPLRPLNNLLWGLLQDSGHRLTAARRIDEYLHLYGLGLGGRTSARFWSADPRSRFVDAFHNLLTLCSEFYCADDNTTVIADGFGVLNALREVHLLLSEGAHNQYGDLPSTARQEMLMQQWILSRPEMRDVLPTLTMVAYPERWMERVEAMNRLQGWSDTSVLHFRDLAVFGEQLLLGIRFGAWTQAVAPDQAANWARYWRAEVQGYVHAHRAVTGVDLAQRGDRQRSSAALTGRQGSFPRRYGASRI
ncbi:hypothetical protein ACI8AF_09920 [Blastococcus sp. SYSU D00669]